MCIILFVFYIKNDAQVAFKINKIIAVSTASGTQEQESDNIWDLNLNQDNDIYIYLEQNKQYSKEDTASKVKVCNFHINKQPEIGTVQVYHDLNEDKNSKTELEYNIAPLNSNIGINNISNKGGIIKFKIINSDLGKYTSNDEIAIRHDGTILNRSEVKFEEIKFEIYFDLIIENQSGKKYKTTIRLNLPNGNILENGVETEEIKDLENIKFQRV